jgi:hypothetical protein
MRENKMKNNKHISKNGFTSQTKHLSSDAHNNSDSQSHKKQTAAETTEISAEERLQLIAKAAYFRSERRNFAPGCELDDWLDAETEIKQRLSAVIAQRTM